MRMAGDAAAVLRRLPKATLLVAGWTCLALVGLVDYVTPSDLSFLIFYLLPVALVTFFVGRYEGVLIAVAGVALWFMINVQDLHPGHGRIVPYWNLLEKLGFFSLMAWLLAALKDLLEHEKALARVDVLTGLPNRRRFQEEAETEIRRSRRYGRPVTLVYIDLDNFKEVNDRQGHAEGDRLLRTLAGTIGSCVREVDIPARLGGDEFAVLMAETGPEAARAAATKLQRTLVEAMERGGWPVTTTIGAVTYLRPPPSADEMIGAADRMMYAGKQRGKNTVAFRTLDPEAEGGGAPARR